MSGLDPLRHGFVNYNSSFLHYADTTLAEVCRSAGLHTAAFIANPILSPGLNFDQGFDEYHELHLARGSELIAQARPFLEERGDERFLLYLHLFDPHRPYVPLATDAAALCDPKPPDYTVGDGVALTRALYGGEEVDETRRQSAIAFESQCYDAEVAGCDRALDELLQLLTELSLRERTVMVITSDHGEAFGEHGRLGHSNGLYDSMLHVPLLFHGPGVPQGERRSASVELKDVPRTLAEVAHLPGAGDLAGSNLLGAGSAPRDGELLFSSTWLGQQPFPDEKRLEEVGRVFRVQSQDWTLVWTPRGDGEGDDLLELISPRDDPFHPINHAADHPEVARRLRSAIVTWMTSTQRDRGTHLSGEGTLDFLRALGYAGD